MYEGWCLMDVEQCFYFFTNFVSKNNSEVYSKSNLLSQPSPKPVVFCKCIAELWEKKEDYIKKTSVTLTFFRCSSFANRFKVLKNQACSLQTHYFFGRVCPQERMRSAATNQISQLQTFRAFC